MSTRTHRLKYISRRYSRQKYNWQRHIEALCSKLASGCYALLRAREHFQINILRIFYFSFIQSHLMYCIGSWGWTFTTYLEPIRRLQKRAVRTITFSQRNETSKPIFVKLQILPFNALREINMVKCVNSIITDNHPFHVSILRMPARPTRNKTFCNFNIPPTRNIYGQRLVEFIGIKIWNDLPFEAKQNKNVSHWLKKYYLQQMSAEPV